MIVHDRWEGSFSDPTLEEQLPPKSGQQPAQIIEGTQGALIQPWSWQHKRPLREQRREVVACVHAKPPSSSTGQRLTRRSPRTLRFQSSDLRVLGYTSIRQRPGRLTPDSTSCTRQPRRAYPNEPAQRAMCATGQRLTRRSPGTLRLQPGDLRIPGYTPIRQRPGRLAPDSTSGTRMGPKTQCLTHMKPRLPMALVGGKEFPLSPWE